MRAILTIGAVSGLALSLLAACGSPGATGGAGGMGTGGGSSSGGGAAPTSSSSGAGGSGGVASSSSGASSSSTASSSGSADPLEAAREACVNRINELRATKGFPALTRWKEAEACVDQEVTEDEIAKQPHKAWTGGQYPCNGLSQNECMGHGVANIVGCVNGLWAEKDFPACVDCDSCLDVKTTQCGPGCDFFGSQTGMVCGHYVNMAAKYITKAACGFNVNGNWDAINFE
jgi:hypothetical protein